MSCISKTIYFNYTTNKIVVAKIQRTADLALYDAETGVFSDSPSNPEILLDENGEIPGLYETILNAGGGWGTGEYVVAFYESNDIYYTTLTLKKIYRFLTDTDRLNVVRGFVEIPVSA